MGHAKRGSEFYHYLPDNSDWREQAELFESKPYREWSEQQTKESEQEQDHDHDER